MKKLVIITAICLAMTCSLPVGAVAMSGISLQQQSEQTVQPDAEVPAQDEAVASEPVNEVQQSRTAAELEKAEKEGNLKKNDSHGFALTIMSMCVVIGALAVLSVLFFIFGTISKNLHTRRKMAVKGIKDTNNMTQKEELASGEVIAAIAMALHDHFNAHDQEHYDLTIKRMKRAYSPWNSKIYNMREVPVLRKFFK